MLNLKPTHRQIKDYYSALDMYAKHGIAIGEKHTVFGLSAMVGISIIFLIKKKKG